MVKRIGGARRKTRYAMKKPLRNKGKISLTRFFATFKEGDKVLLNPEPGIQKGIAYKRFFGKVGVIKGKQGKSYKVELKDHDKMKTVLAHAVHLRRI